jgi:hypothetical protein
LFVVRAAVGTIVGSSGMASMMLLRNLALTTFRLPPERLSIVLRTGFRDETGFLFLGGGRPSTLKRCTMATGDMIVHVSTRSGSKIFTVHGRPPFAIATFSIWCCGFPSNPNIVLTIRILVNLLHPRL